MSDEMNRARLMERKTDTPGWDVFMEVKMDWSPTGDEEERVCPSVTVGHDGVARHFQMGGYRRDSDGPFLVYYEKDEEELRELVRLSQRESGTIE